MYFHPYAALIDHSSDYNSVVLFDGEELFVKAIRPIKKGEQIFRSYIDVIHPYAERLGSFGCYLPNCQCIKCNPDLVQRATPNPGRLLGRRFSPRENAVNGAYNSLMFPDVINLSPEARGRKFATDMRSLHRTGVPITEQPYAPIRDKFIKHALATGQLNKAFIHVAIFYVRIDLVLLPNDAHPIHKVHAWLMAKLARRLSQATETNSSDSNAPQGAQLDFGLISWSITHELVSRQKESCTVPSFKDLIKTMHDEANNVYGYNKQDSNSLNDAIEREWRKLEGVISEELEKE